ncbi:MULTISPECIES: arginine synthesis PII-interacting regulator PirA [Cyanophyceae]|uniref:DUF4278 domain-containing protein n=1 Tax=Leptolyngbya subtilissima DQ-A4 TaxID=2933933 RepID=A0ABV0K783_9CYAN|nr:DUF4278 domain-containing protein [Nodosilinea sp. FACHB-141]MBD2113925.1 DUF4278 domain-containing protein [Nodosilinea sp. FACHB-141]
MKLCYRGVDYDYNPPSLEVRESELTGSYRGRPIKFSYVKHLPITQPIGNYTYRGVSYSTNCHGQIESSTAASDRQPVLQAERTAAGKGLPARRHLLQEAAEAHRTSIQQSTQHRIEVARAQGNDQLLKQLEAELHQVV